MTPMNNKKVLMIAFDFPPCQSAGVQRTLSFAHYLSDFGWQPIILTVKDYAHSKLDNSVHINENLKPWIHRAGALDASRHFAIKGKYFSWSRIPDKWWTWAFTGVALGKQLIRQYRPDVIWSTYPIPTANFIAYRLQKQFNIPWVADFRDPVQCRYDPSAQQYAWAAKWIERKTITHAKQVVFTTQQAANLYTDLYPFEQPDKFNVIQNGFDEQRFSELSLSYQKPDKFRLLYSGAIYDNGRDPTILFEALSMMKQNHQVDSKSFELVFQGSQLSVELTNKIQALKIQDLVRIEPSVPYLESLESMSQANALLVIQDKLFKNQIPGKIYEYIRIGKPIVALTPRKSATGELVDSLDCSVSISTVDQTIQVINQMLSNRKQQPENSVDQFSRYQKTQELSQLLDRNILSSVNE